MLAVLAAVRAYQQEEDARREADRRLRLDTEEEARLAEKEAAEVTINCSVGGYRADEIHELRVTITNGTTGTPLYRLEGRAEFGKLQGWPKVKGLTSVVHRHNFQVMQFRVGQPRKRATGPKVPMEERAAWLADQASKATIRFEMNGRKWKRTGNQAVEQDAGDD
jgi:hypothetical protein